MKKRFSAIFFVFVALSMVLGITAYAAEARYSYTTSVSSTLTISSGTAYCRSSCRGNASVTQISGTQYLEKKNGTSWSTVSSGTWTGSSNSNSLTMSNNKSSLSSGTYRVRAVFTVYSGGNYETVEAISKEVTK